VGLLTAAQMRAIEQAAIASGEVTGLELMERAGQGVVEAIFEEWPELKATSHRAVVLCGPGNNGGDGFVVARLLKEWGWQVEVFLYGDPDKLPPDARANYERWKSSENSTGVFSFRVGGAVYETEVDVIIDAIFGTGLTRGLPDDIGECAQTFDLYRNPELADLAPKIVAVDISSGISSDTGAIVPNGPHQDAFRADLTVTFHSKKIGHSRGAGLERSGRVIVKDISL
jgi:ADP-dependent NAD(P)H-hydrate dehydratase / NAD(P)H-hydrate epimerase